MAARIWPDWCYGESAAWLVGDERISEPREADLDSGGSWGDLNLPRFEVYQIFR